MKLKGYCKKDYDADSNFNYYFRLKRGNVYEYEVVSDNVIIIHNLNSRFYLYQNMDSAIFPTFSEYFYTEIEIRKLKLNKLNEKR